jgi:hypothetical protein
MVRQQTTGPGIAQDEFICQIDELTPMNVHVSDLHINQRTVLPVWFQSPLVDLQQPLVRENKDAPVAVAAALPQLGRLQFGRERYLLAIVLNERTILVYPRRPVCESAVTYDKCQAEGRQQYLHGLASSEFNMALVLSLVVTNAKVLVEEV